MSLHPGLPARISPTVTPNPPTPPLKPQHAKELETVLSRLKDEQRAEHDTLQERYEADLARIRAEHDEELKSFNARQAGAADKVREV